MWQNIPALRLESDGKSRRASLNGQRLPMRIVAVLVFLLPTAGWCAEVSVIGLFPNKAVVVIDGSPPRVLTAGTPPVNGGALFSTARETATFLIDGQKKPLKLGQHQAGPTSTTSSAQS